MARQSEAGNVRIRRRKATQTQATQTGNADADADADEAGGSKLQDMYVQRQTGHVPCGCVSDLDRNFPAHALPCRPDLQAAIRKPQFVLYCP